MHPINKLISGVLLGIFSSITLYAQPTAVANFTIPDTVCINQAVSITNTSTNASSYFWNFCVANINQSPVGTNLGNIGGELSQPVFMDYVQYNNNYYGFSINHWPGKLIRLDFGNSLLNTPTAIDMGNFGGIIPSGFGAEGIQIVQNEGRWYAIIVGGYTPSGSTPRILNIDFGPDLLNLAPVATNWGNIGNMLQPLDLHVFKEGNEWYGLTVNGENNTITRFSFSSSFNNQPTAVNLGGFGMLDYPTGIYAINDNGSWYVFVTNNGSTSRLVRLNFGNSLLNTPTATNLGPIGTQNGLRDLVIVKYCDEITGFAVNASANSIFRLNFPTITSVPNVSNLGNTGNLNVPHSISRLFRVNENLYSFITNVGNNTITRLQFTGCTNSNLPNSTLANPTPIRYNAPGVYNINLTINDGLPTQSAICKPVVVIDCSLNSDTIIINDYTEVISFGECKNILNVGDATKFNVGDTVMLMQMKGAVVDSSNTASFGTVTDYKNAGNYEYNYIKNKTGNALELLNIVNRKYDLPDGKVQLIRVPYYQNYDATKVLSCLPWDGSKGGVLAFNVANTLTLGENIDVSGRGFRGGIDPFSNPTQMNCYENNLFYPRNPDLASGKGEGIAVLSAAKSFGKGAIANGGGGGNSHNSGGGGGSNASVAGFGGYNSDLSPCNTNVPFDNRGIGGKALPYSNALNKLFLGGGGGAGQSNNVEGFQATGGNGGGMVIITAGSLISASHSINANGDHGKSCIGSDQLCSEGMGGGGAGGNIVLDIVNYADMAFLNARGGDGANMVAANNGRIGPGGGGTGGVFWLRDAGVPANVTRDNMGGINGINFAFSNDPWGATSGSNGTTLLNLNLPVSTTSFKINIDSVRIRNTAQTCTRFRFEGFGYVNTFPVSTWEWTFGDGNTSNTQNPTHTYVNAGNYDVKLIVTDVNGCKDSFTVSVQPQPLDFDFHYKTDVCGPLHVQFNGIGNTTINPYWDFGSGNVVTGTIAPTFTFPSYGSYPVKYAVGNGACTDTITKTVVIGIEWQDLILTPDTTICIGSTKLLRTVPTLSFCWSPTTYLNNPTLANPTTSTPDNITYYFTAEVEGNNLIANGNFSAGNTGFTSAYVNNTTSGIAEGTYTVSGNVKSWHGGLSDCKGRGGSGNMMLVNGSSGVGTKIWTHTVAVQPNTQYAFSTWLQSLSPNSPAQLQFSINDNPIGTDFDASVTTCVWDQFYTTWNSGSSTSATISIINKNTAAGGNDFALDDISFAPLLLKWDSVRITVERPMIMANNDTLICAGRPVQLNATGAASYVWIPSTSISATNTSNPVANPVMTTQYIVEGTTVNGCVAKDTVNIAIFDKPVTTITPDAEVCVNTQVQLEVTGGVSYQWNPNSTLSQTNIADPIATPNQDTRYYVTITDANTCEHLDSVMIRLRPVAQFAVNGNNRMCTGDSVRLLASGGTTYLWQPATGLNDPGIADPWAAPGGNTIYSVTISESVCNTSTTLTTAVDVLVSPVVTANRSNDLDCSNDRSQLSASGAVRYEWSPAIALNDANVRNPVATPNATTSYAVKGYDDSGCAGYDTVIVKVDNINKGGYLMPNAFSPNNDGLNDCYGIRYWGVLEKVEFSIFNRWGERVFLRKIHEPVGMENSMENCRMREFLST
ncbi:PKD domain-containing protein [Ferruginibacter sp.]